MFFIIVLLCMNVCFSFSERMPSSHLIAFSIENGDEPVKPLDNIDSEIKKVIKPGDGARLLLQSNLKHHPRAGVYATYLGWSALSDRNGQVILPRKHDEDRVQLVITRSLQPVMSEEVVIHHFVAGFDEPVAFYDFYFKEDYSKKTAQWTVKKIPTPPSRIIPLNAVVLIAAPDQMYIKEGTFPALKGGNLILPTLYARSNLTPGKNAIYFLRINRYFAPVEYAWRFATTQYAKLVLS